MLQRFPIFKSSTQVRDDDGSADQGCDSHSFVHFLRSESNLLAFTQVVLHAVVAPQHQGARKADELLGFYIQNTGRIGIRVKIEYSFQDQIVCSADLVIHALTVFVKLSYDVHDFEV